MADKIYCGNGKEHTFKDGGKILKLSFSKKELQIMLANVNEKGYVNTNVCKRKEPSKFGQTHYLTIDDWQPDKKADVNAGSNELPLTEPAKTDDSDMPF